MAAAEKTQRYEAFISDVLQRDLRRVQEQREAVHEQQAQVLQLQAALARLQPGPPARFRGSGVRILRGADAARGPSAPGAPQLLPAEAQRIPDPGRGQDPRSHPAGAGGPAGAAGAAGPLPHPGAMRDPWAGPAPTRV
ncbi:protein UXT isoform X5 [Poecile atricapillus]|uniref:protein UXT isoform X5 n=1 Tax=Poecile atricapillus TaxID=48891 RepID=UPI0027394D1C|nr:protein UXT isoform X5 [Poecile atricapillus]